MAKCGLVTMENVARKRGIFSDPLKFKRSSFPIFGGYTVHNLQILKIRESALPILIQMQYLLAPQVCG